VHTECVPSLQVISVYHLRGRPTHKNQEHITRLFTKSNLSQKAIKIAEKGECPYTKIKEVWVQSLSAVSFTFNFTTKSTVQKNSARSINRAKAGKKPNITYVTKGRKKEAVTKDWKSLNEIKASLTQ